MGQNQSDRRKGGRGNSSRSKPKANTSSTSSKKTLEDHKYDIGSAKNASEYISTTKFLIQRIATTFLEADDVATALRDGKEFNLDAKKPTLQVSTNSDQAIQDRENKEFERLYDKRCDAHVD